MFEGQSLRVAMELALATDGRVMSESAQVGLPEVSLGLFPGLGGTVRLPRLTALVQRFIDNQALKKQSKTSAPSTGGRGGT